MYNALPTSINQRPRYATAWCMLIVVGLLATTGCKESEPISQYRKPKEKVVLKAEPGDTVRSLAGMIVDGGQVWYVKVFSEKSVVDQIQSDLTAFLKSLRVDEETDSLNWALPNGWIVGDPDSDPMKSQVYLLKAPADGGVVEVAISRLPFRGDYDEYLLSNINRWRTQVGLEAVESAVAANEYTTLDLGDHELLLFNYEGVEKAGGSRAPFMEMMQQRGGMTNPHGPNGPQIMAPESADPGVEFTAPDDWVKGPSSQFTTLAFAIENDLGTARVTVSALPANKNDWRSNVKRWCDELGLTMPDETELAQQTVELTLSGQPAQSIVLSNENEQSLGIFSIHGDKAWFVKMKGDKALVESQQAAFDAFAASLKL